MKKMIFKINLTDLLTDVTTLADEIKQLKNEHGADIVDSLDFEIAQIENVLENTNFKNGEKIENRNAIINLFQVPSSIKTPNNATIKKMGEATLKEYIEKKDKFEEIFAPNGTFFKFLKAFDKRTDEFTKLLPVDVSDEKTSKKGIDLEPEQKLTSSQMDILKKSLPKEDLIKVIMRRHPNVKKEDLEALSIDDLIQVSNQLGINLSM